MYVSNYIKSTLRSISFYWTGSSRIFDEASRSGALNKNVAAPIPTNGATSGVPVTKKANGTPVPVAEKAVNA